VDDDHLIFGNKMREAMRKNNAKIILVDPRKTSWEKWANLWIRPLPGTDLAWINGLIRSHHEKNGFSKEFYRLEDRGFWTFFGPLREVIRRNLLRAFQGSLQRSWRQLQTLSFCP